MRYRVLALAVAVGTIGAVLSAEAQETGQLNTAEQEAMGDTVQHALEYNRSGKASEWVNPDTESSGGVTPVRTFENAQGQPCREFVTKIIIGGNEEQGYGTACRQPDGSWKIVPEEQGTASQTAPPAPPQQAYDYPPPDEYYAYPAGFYGPFGIYLSFSTVHRGGYVYHGHRYLEGREFRHRHPLIIRHRRFVGPRIYDRYRWQERWEHEEHRGRGDYHRNDRGEYREDRGEHRWERSEHRGDRGEYREDRGEHRGDRDEGWSRDRDRGSHWPDPDRSRDRDDRGRR